MNTFGKVLVLTAVAIAGVGCAGTTGMTDEEKIVAVVNNWEASVVQQDPSLVEPHYSENYQDAQASSKEEALEWISGVMEQGFLENAEVQRADAEISFEDETSATYGPIDLTSDAGSWTVDIYVNKEDGEWYITSVDVY